MIIGSHKKLCMFTVTLPYLIFLVKPSNFFHVFLKKKSITGIKQSVAGIRKVGKSKQFDQSLQCLPL